LSPLGKIIYSYRPQNRLEKQLASVVKQCKYIVTDFARIYYFFTQYNNNNNNNNNNYYYYYY